MTASWCQLDASKTRTATFVKMVNNCIPGVTSLADHLKSHWLFPGALISWLMVYKQAHLADFDFLCSTILTPSSLDIDFLMGVPIAGIYDPPDGADG